MRRYLFFFFTTAGLALALTACLSLVFEPFEPIAGDLTRIGNYAEKDFGWHAPQPVIQIHGNGKYITDPDILVLGDSFSVGNIWQSVLATMTHKKVKSFAYSDAGCLDNWTTYALRDSTAKIVIVQLVERNFVSRFGSITACRPKLPMPIEILPSQTAPSRQGAPEWHIFRTVRVSANTLKMHYSPHEVIQGDVVNAPIDTRCAKFSNLRADRLIYFSKDEEKLGWKPEQKARAISNLLALQHLFAKHGKQFIFLLIPDKLSTYGHCLLNQAESGAHNASNISHSLIAAGAIMPDLLTLFTTSTSTTVDLYRPNDTHLSETGYVLVAKHVARYLTMRPTVSANDVPPQQPGDWLIGN